MTQRLQRLAATTDEKVSKLHFYSLDDVSQMCSFHTKKFCCLQLTYCMWTCDVGMWCKYRVTRKVYFSRQMHWAIFGGRGRRGERGTGDIIIVLHRCLLVSTWQVLIQLYAVVVICLKHYALVARIRQDKLVTYLTLAVLFSSFRPMSACTTPFLSNLHVLLGNENGSVIG